jgi:FkbM family methyltransferase
MKNLIKNIIPANSELYKIAQNFYNYRYWHPKEWKGDVLEDYAQFKKKVNFIQIGSCDGITADPINNLINKYEWHGILVEPVPYLFDKLKKNYEQVKGRLTFENSAIATSNGQLKFYRLKKSESSDLPAWYDQLGSFSKDVVFKHKDSIPHFDELLIEDTVNAITFNDLVKKHSVEKIDFIQIDAEGYDYEILKMIPFSKYEIDFIMFENRHLSESDYKEALNLLKQYGFKVGSKYKDTIAINKKIVPFISFPDGTGKNLTTSGH